MKTKRRNSYVGPLFWALCESIALIFGGLIVMCWQTVESELGKVAVSPSSPIHVRQFPSSLPPKPIIPDYVLPPIENGEVPVISSIPTQQKVVFLTIDDGAYKSPSVAGIMKKNNIKASLFLSRTFIDSDPDFFQQLITQGSSVENHTLSHDINMTTNLNYDGQVQEICGMTDYIEQQYGRRPLLFRPPGGTYDETTRQAAANCGMKALVDWTAKANGGSMQYQVGQELHPGDIVLMHFRPEFAHDMQAFVDAKNKAGLQTELLEDWLQLSDTSAIKVDGE